MDFGRQKTVSESKNWVIEMTECEGRKNKVWQSEETLRDPWDTIRLTTNALEESQKEKKETKRKTV